MLAATAVDMSTVAPSYKCNNPAAPGICYGVGSQTDSLFRSIQSLANYFAPVAGFSVISIDGKIGASTVAAIAAGARAMLQNPSTSAFDNNLMALAATKELLAQNAATVWSTLQSGISAMGLTPVAAPTSKEVIPGTAYTPPVTLAPLSGGGWKPWAIGVGILAAAAGITYYVYTSN